MRVKNYVKRGKIEESGGNEKKREIREENKKKTRMGDGDRT